MSVTIKRAPKNATIDDRLNLLQKQIEQLNEQLESSMKEVAALKLLVDPEIKTRRLLNLIRELNVHTSAMPDMKGYNADHDRRYLRNDGSATVPGIYFGTGGRRLWWAGIDSGDWVLRFDANLGVGVPDFAAGEVLRYHPNFD